MRHIIDGYPNARIINPSYIYLLIYAHVCHIIFDALKFSIR